MSNSSVNIKLTQGFQAVVDNCDADLINCNWQAKPNSKGRIYAKRKGIKGKDNKRTILMHRVILSRKLGRELDDKELVDHRDGNGLNNRRSNLRLATNIQNQQNAKRHVDNTSGYKNVRLTRGKWMARVSVNKKRLYLGTFDTPELAYAAVKAATIEYHGEYARIQ